MIRQVFAALVALAFLSTAAAQGSRVDQARALTEQGRLGEARTLLRTELDEAPAPAVAFNLALVEHSIGDFEAAEALFVRLLTNEFGDLPPARRERAGELMAQSIAEMGTLVLHWEGEPSVTVRVDGRPRGTIEDEETLRIRVNPGLHVVSARASSGAEVSQEVDLARSGARELELSELAIDLTGTYVPPPRRTWPYWLVAGAVVLAGGALAAVLLTRDSEPPVPDGYLGVVQF